MLIAIDPGPTESGVVKFESPTGPFVAAKLPNDQLLKYLSGKREMRLAIETMTSTGMAVGAETFKTCIWIGRFLERHGGPHRLIKRGEVKLHLCGTMQARDPNIRQALVDRFGDKGTKKAPGKLYGFHSDLYSALAIGLTALETPETKEEP
jgi:hypothetical protein